MRDRSHLRVHAWLPMRDRPHLRDSCLSDFHLFYDRFWAKFQTHTTSCFASQRSFLGKTNKRTQEVKSLNFHSVTLFDFTFSCSVHGSRTAWRACSIWWVLKMLQRVYAQPLTEVQNFLIIRVFPILYSIRLIRRISWTQLEPIKHGLKANEDFSVSPTHSWLCGVIVVMPGWYSVCCELKAHKGSFLVRNSLSSN